ASVAVALTTEVSGDPNALGSAYALSPTPLPLAKPTLLVFRAAGGPAPALGLVTVSLAVKTASGTFVAMGGRVDPAAGTLSVPIASTNPSVVAGEAAGRVALDGPPAIVVPLTNLVILPSFPVVLTDGSVRLAVTLQHPPSAGTRFSSFEFRIPGNTTITVQWTQPNLGRIDNLKVSPVTYTAPHRIRSSYAVATAWVTIRANDANTRLQLGLPADVIVLRRDWSIETEVKVDLPCEVPVIRPYSLSWTGKSKRNSTLTIADNFTITKKSDALYQADSHWDLCPAPYYGFTNITATGDSKLLDVQLENGPNGSPLSHFDVENRRFVIHGRSEFRTGGALLTGPGVSPLDIATTGEYSLPFVVDPRYYAAGEWFEVEPAVPYVTMHRHRLFSVDTP
ncbi:MAG: hypothetical protein NEA02_09145, partial [Thermoanaerobaculia bacterium]|nr:hypothetical protein [Thermoanaerobaculia bacterium]